MADIKVDQQRYIAALENQRNTFANEAAMTAAALEQTLAENAQLRAQVAALIPREAPPVEQPDG